MHEQRKNVVSMSIESIQRLSTYDNLKAKDFRVLLFLMARLDSIRFKKIDKKQISRELGLKKKEVENSLLRLLDSFILEIGDDEHVRRGYKFNL